MPSAPFDFKESDPIPKVVATVYGDKGHGKTWYSFTYPEPIYCLSYDMKSSRVKLQFPEKEIHVYNAVEYMRHSERKILESSVTTLRYIVYLLKEIKKRRPKTIIHDGLQILQEIAEMNMRAKHNLKPFQNFSNWNFWKDRKMILRQIHELSMEAIQEQGNLIYTTYVKMEKTVKDGAINDQWKRPNYIDMIERRTDDKIYVFARQEDEGAKFYAVNQSIKSGRMGTGTTQDFTGMIDQPWIEEDEEVLEDEEEKEPDEIDELLGA